MKKLYIRSELGFALLWIGAYCVFMSLGDILSQRIGTEKIITLPVAAILSAVLLVFIKKGALSEKYGLCKPCVSASGVLYYVPLFLLLPVNLWHGFTLNISMAETALYALTMLFVGFLEEVIFRGLLFNAMKKDNLKAAIAVSALTFGMGHIINLFNGAELIPNILQIIYATATGFMLVMLFVRTKSLIVPVAFHGIFNALSAFSDDGLLTEKDRIVSCIFIVAVSILYALYLIFAKKERNKIDNPTC